MRWRNSKVILGCAIFHDLLQPVAHLSKVLQQDQLCVVQAIEVPMKTKKNLDKLKSTPFEELPSVKRFFHVLRRTPGLLLTRGKYLTRHEEGTTFLKTHQIEYFEAVDACIQNRVKTGETEILAHAITNLATHGWNRSPTLSASVFIHPWRALVLISP